MNESAAITKHKSLSPERKLGRMIKKMQSDHPWNGLTFAQCETVERWLFDEHLSYAAAAERVTKEFGKETSLWSIGRFYRCRARLRQAMELLDAQVAASQLGSVPANTRDLREMAVKLTAKNAMRLATEQPEDMEGLRDLTKLLLESEENEIRLRRVKLEERCFDFEANKSCAGDLKKVRAYITAVGDNENLSPVEKQQRVVELLYGKDEADDQKEGKP